MSNLINARPRFAWDASVQRIFDYLTNKQHLPTGVLKDKDGGSWDLAHVKHLLTNGLHVEGARQAPAPEPMPATPPAPDPAAVAEASSAETEWPTAGESDELSEAVVTAEAPTTEESSNVETDDGAAQGTS